MNRFESSKSFNRTARIALVGSSVLWLASCTGQKPTSHNKAETGVSVEKLLIGQLTSLINGKTGVATETSASVSPVSGGYDEEYQIKYPDGSVADVQVVDEMTKNGRVEVNNPIEIDMLIQSKILLVTYGLSKGMNGVWDASICQNITSSLPYCQGETGLTDIYTKSNSSAAYVSHKSPTIANLEFSAVDNLISENIFAAANNQNALVVPGIKG